MCIPNVTSDLHGHCQCCSLSINYIDPFPETLRDYGLVPSECEHRTVHTSETVTLQNGNCYTSVHVTKCYMIQSNTCYNTIEVQNDTSYKIVNPKTVYVTKWYLY